RRAGARLRRPVRDAADRPRRQARRGAGGARAQMVGGPPLGPAPRHGRGMITLTALLEIVAVEEAELRFWIASGWVRPERQEPDLLFGEVDVARARLIAEMRRDLALDEDTVPLILSLVDQVYGLRHAL